jgi:hypothetical protein
MSPNIITTTDGNEDSSIIQHIIKRIVSKVVRLDTERQRQVQVRKRNKSLKSSHNNKKIVSNKNKWFRNKYRDDSFFRSEKLARMSTYARSKYNNSIRFRQGHQLRMKMYFSKNIIIVDDFVKDISYV